MKKCEKCDGKGRYQGGDGETWFDCEDCGATGRVPSSVVRIPSFFGPKVRLTCPNCSMANKPDRVTCASCGKPLDKS